MNAEQIKTKVVKVNIGGKERTLRFTLNSMIEIEEGYGSIQGAMKAMETSSMKAVRLLLWAGLIHEEPELDINAVGNWIDMSNLQYTSEKLGEAFKACMPNENTSPNK